MYQRKMSKIQKLLIVTDDDVAQARKHYQKSEIDIQQDVAILKEWLRQQPHLPNDEDETRLESMFLKNKCRLEQTKRKLDKYYSFKLIYPEMLHMYDVNSAYLQNARNSFIYVPLPNLTDKQERVFCFKMINPDVFCGLDFILYLFLMIELCHNHDYALGDIYVIDWHNLTFNAMKTMDPNVLQKFALITEGVLSGRVITINHINTPSFMNIFMKVAKVCMNPKLFKKVNFNATLENVYEAIPKHILPVEYGGEEKSIHSLHDEWGEELLHHADALMKISNTVSDEKLRIGKLENSDLFGTDGSFRKLNLD